MKTLIHLCRFNEYKVIHKVVLKNPSSRTVVKEDTGDIVDNCREQKSNPSCEQDLLINKNINNGLKIQHLKKTKFSKTVAI